MIERRFAPASSRIVALTVETRDDGRPRFRGYAAVFNSASRDLGGFREIILPGAFDAVLARRQSGPGRPSAASKRQGDCIACWNHDPGQLLGRTSAGTLRLSVDDVGLRFEIDPPDTQLARDLISLTRRNDVFGASFAFTVDPAHETYSQTDAGAVRTIRAVSGLYDISLVTNPAYMGTVASVRDAAPRSLRLRSILARAAAAAAIATAR